MRTRDRVTDGMSLITNATARPAEIIRDLKRLLGASLERAFYSRAGRTYDFRRTDDASLRRLRFDARISGRDIGAEGVSVGMVVDSFNDGSRLKARLGCTCSQRGCEHAKSALVELALAGRPDVEVRLREELGRTQGKTNVGGGEGNSDVEGQAEIPQAERVRERTELPPQGRMSNGAFAILGALAENKAAKDGSTPRQYAKEDEARADVRFLLRRATPSGHKVADDVKGENLVMSAYVRMAGRPEEPWRIFGRLPPPADGRFERVANFAALLGASGKSLGWEEDRVLERASDACLSMVALGYDVSAREVIVSTAEGFDLLKALCKSGLLVVGEERQRTVTLGEPLAVLGDWEQQEKGCWTLVTNLLPSIQLIGSDAGMWYLDEENAKIGRMAEGESQLLAEMARKGMWITDGDIETLPKRMLVDGLENVLPPLPRIEVFKGEPLQAGLKLQLSDEVDSGGYRPYGYGGWKGKTKSQGTKATLQIDRPSVKGGVTQVDGSIVVYEGNTRSVHVVDDEAARKRLEEVKLSLPKLEWQNDSIILSQSERHDVRANAAFEFQRKVVPRLKAQGLEVGYGINFEWRLHEDSDWNIEIVEDGARWYSATVTTSVGGRRVDMTKVVRAIVADPKFSAWLDDERKTRWTFEVSRGNFVDIPKERIRRLLGGLMDLNGKPVSESGKIKLSKFDMNAVSALTSVDGVVVRGGEELVRQAKVLGAFDDTPDPALAGIMKLPPRHYQWVGLNWMRARYREGFGCILGDEMAAGKTVQTLMHIQSTAAAVGERRRPSLVVATKTILETRTWEAEIEKFFPNMTSVQYAGTHRTRLLSDLNDFDVVLVTYQTLANDLHRLSEIDWNIIAADEGHKMCNGRTDAARAFEAIVGRQKVIRNSPTIAVIDGGPVQISTRGRSRPKPTRQV